MNTPDELRYAKSHEWVRTDDGDVVTVGITDHAQDQLGDVVFVELPEVGRKVNAGDTVAVIESVKTASDIYTPVSGVVSAINDTLEARPEAINLGPYGDGWLFKVTPSNTGELADLLDADAYNAQATEE